MYENNTSTGLVHVRMDTDKAEFDIQICDEREDKYSTCTDDTSASKIFGSPVSDGGVNKQTSMLTMMEARSFTREFARSSLDPSYALFLRRHCVCVCVCQCVSVCLCVSVLRVV